MAKRLGGYKCLAILAGRLRLLKAARQHIEAGPKAQGFLEICEGSVVETRRAAGGYKLVGEGVNQWK